MRLKEDTSSWHSSSIIKRDFRHNPEVASRKPRSKKDTKRWCRGKVGVKHVFQLIERAEFKVFAWNTNKCVNCGKKISEVERIGS